MFNFETILAQVTFDWKMIVEILMLWYIFYWIIVFLKDTKAVYVVRGLSILLAMFFLVRWLDLTILSWILTKMFAISVIAVLIIFQTELREGLVYLGRRSIFYTGFKEEEAESIIRELSSAVSMLSKKKIGALVAVQREMGLKNYIESGISLDADISSELIQTIFNPKSPLHDGGVIIVGDKVASAASLFPLSDNPDIDKTFGMRHRAGIGLSEESDAVIILVSEETGMISLAINGRLTKNLNKEELVTILKGLLKKRSKS